MIPKIVFLEDDFILGTLISKGLQKAGFEVELIGRLEKLHETVQMYSPDIVVLDLEIEGRNSLEAVPALRRLQPQLPIIFASSHTNGKEIVACLNWGDTDYIKKPYDVEELIYHIHHCLATVSADTICFGHYQLNLQTRDLAYKEQKIQTLNPKEFDLLHILLVHKEETVERKELLEKVWHNLMAEESLNNYIAYLRKYLNKDPQIKIRTIKRKGYILTCEG